MQKRNQHNRTTISACVQSRWNRKNYSEGSIFWPRTKESLSREIDGAESALAGSCVGEFKTKAIHKVKNSQSISLSNPQLILAITLHPAHNAWRTSMALSGEAIAFAVKFGACEHLNETGPEPMTSTMSDGLFSRYCSVDSPRSRRVPRPVITRQCRSITFAIGCYGTPDVELEFRRRIRHERGMVPAPICCSMPS